LSENDGTPYDQPLEGRFTTTGFRATVFVDIFRPAGRCRTVLDWSAVKQGAHNVIPG
jgi:hypothetical protein